MPNPKSMTDEELEKALAEGGAPTPETEEEPAETPETPEVEEPSEEEEPETEEPENEEQPEEEEEPKPPSRREQLRIADLLKKYGPQGTPEPQKQTPANPDALNYDDLEADDELKKKLNQDRQAAVDAAFQRGRAQSNSILFHTRLEIDAPKIEAKYPALDKTSDKFKPKLANDINTMYLNMVGYDAKADTVQNPKLRYSDFVDTFYSAVADAAGEQVETTTKNVKAQAAKTGLRPGGQTPKRLNLNKPASQMTDEELDAVIAQAVPSK